MPAEIRTRADVTEEHIEAALDMRDGGSDMESAAIKYLQREVNRRVRGSSHA